MLKLSNRFRPSLGSLDDRIVPALFTWTATAGGFQDFGNSANWSAFGSDDDGVPDSNDSIIIPNGKSDIEESNDVTSVVGCLIGGDWEGVFKSDGIEFTGTIEISSGEFQATGGSIVFRSGYFSPEASEVIKFTEPGGNIKFSPGDTEWLTFNEGDYSFNGVLDFVGYGSQPLGEIGNFTWIDTTWESLASSDGIKLGHGIVGALEGTNVITGLTGSENFTMDGVSTELWIDDGGASFEVSNPVQVLNHADLYIGSGSTLKSTGTATLGGLANTSVYVSGDGASITMDGNDAYIDATGRVYFYDTVAATGGLVLNDGSTNSRSNIKSLSVEFVDSEIRFLTGGDGRLVLESQTGSTNRLHLGSSEVRMTFNYLSPFICDRIETPGVTFNTGTFFIPSYVGTKDVGITWKAIDTNNSMTVNANPSVDTSGDSTATRQYLNNDFLIDVDYI